MIAEALESPHSVFKVQNLQNRGCSSSSGHLPRHVGKSFVRRSVAFNLDSKASMDLGVIYGKWISVAELFLAARDPKFVANQLAAMGRAKGPRYKLKSAKVESSLVMLLTKAP